jgi:hypothetical protein
MLTIIICGDLLNQVNLAEGWRPSTAGKATYNLTVEDSKDQESSPTALVEAAVSDLKPLPRIVTARSPAFAQSFVLWELFGRELNVKARKEDARVWRICRHLGMTPSTATFHASDTGDSPNPDVLLIDDLGLGFRDDSDLWPKALKAGGRPKSIILKCDAPLVRSKLWEYLVPDHADRLTVIVPIHLLRARGASISAPLSWDLTIQEIAREFESGTSAGDLARVRRIIVPLCTDGAASFSRLDPYAGPKASLLPRLQFERCLYDPANLEGAWEVTRPGSVIDSSALVAAAMVRHELSPETYPLFIALGRALRAARAAHADGAGPVDKLNFAKPIVAVKEAFHPPPERVEPAGIYYSAFSHECLDNIEPRTRTAKDPAKKSETSNTKASQAGVQPAP